MNTILGGRTIQRRCWQRRLAGLLLFLLVSDLGYHFVEGFLEPPENAAVIALRFGLGNSEPAGGCGIPDHDGTPFHHHHFPAVVSQAPPPVPLIALAVLTTMPAIEAIHSSSVTPIGRA